MSVPSQFYLSSRENTGEWSRVRTCRVEARLQGPYHDQYARILVDPPVLQVAGEEDGKLLIISPHSANTTLFPVSEWPLSVYVYIPLSNRALFGDSFEAHDVRLAAWCEIYPALEEAQRVAVGVDN